MKYSREKLIDENKVFTKDDFIFFWSAGKGNKIDKGCLSQWYMSDFIIDGRRYCCAEQFMMAKKAELFKDYETLKEILKATSPKRIKELGRQVRNFEPSRWNAYKTGYVRQANLAKFSQKQELRDFICGTRGKILVEASPYDRIWGIGMYESNKKSVDPSSWLGTNLLGFILMEVRDEIMNSTQEQFSMDIDLEIDRQTGEISLKPYNIVNDNYIPPAKDLWERMLKEEEEAKIISKAKGNRRISNQLYKYLRENFPEIADKNLKEREL